MKRDDLPGAFPSPSLASLRADPLADAVIARILGAPGPQAGPDLATIGRINAEIASWQLNGDLDAWRASPAASAQMAQALEEYVQAARALPDWADPVRIARAERVFMDIGMLSCTLLFCASLPQCYLIPDLAAVLHVAGQLEQHTDYRVRATAAMIFPVMMRGGLSDAGGGGVAQALKVRLIHATIRWLILRGAVPDAAADGAPEARSDGASAPALARQTPAGPSLHDRLYAHGWDSARQGMPCNQEELAYTLLTFGYVFLDALRRLGVGLARADEEAFLHTWNVLGHLLGIERALMPDTMDAARLLFEDIQARGRLQPRHPDLRPALAAALVGNLQRYIPLRLLKPFPALLMRTLCGPAASRDLGLDTRVAWPARAAFVLCLGATRALDATVRRVVPGFSLARLAGRLLGYRLTVTMLMDQTRPLKLPTALLGQIGEAVCDWQDDPAAPRWINALERRGNRRSMTIPTTPTTPPG
jgi:hypothetical protein